MSTIQSIDLQFSAEFDKLEKGLESIDKKMSKWANGFKDNFKPLQSSIDDTRTRSKPSMTRSR